MPEESEFNFEDWRRQFESQYDRLIHIGDRVFGETAAPLLEMTSAKPVGPRPAGARLMSTVENLSLNAARERLAFTLPSWVPDGFVLEPFVRVRGPSKEPLPEPLTGKTITFPLSANVMWRHADERWLGLNAVSLPTMAGMVTGITTPVPPNGVKEVRVNGQPAALISRMWVTLMNTLTGEASGPHAKAVIIHLEWKLNDISYTLRTGAGHLTEAELIRVAESIQ